MMNFKINLTPDASFDLRKSPHILVSGVTGSAKSTALMGINLRAMTSKDVAEERGPCALSFFIDPKNAEFSRLDNYLENGGKRVVTTSTMAAKLLRITCKNMEARYRHLNADFGGDFSSVIRDGKVYRPVLVTIDELASLLLDKKTRDEILGYMAKLLLLGRQAGFFLCLGMQRPDATSFPRQLSLECNTRILMRPNSADNDSKRMLYPFVDPKQLPITADYIGNGLIFAEGNGWQVPHPFVLPNYMALDIPSVIQRIERNIDPNWFIDESDYWQWI